MRAVGSSQVFSMSRAQQSGFLVDVTNELPGKSKVILVLSVTSFFFLFIHKKQINPFSDFKKQFLCYSLDKLYTVKSCTNLKF